MRSFPDLEKRLHSGTTVYVIDKVGTETKGKIVDVSASALVLDVEGSRRRMEQSSVLQVQRLGDSLWNGLLIGLGVGVSAMLISDPAYERCIQDPRNVCANPHAGERIIFVAIMGAAGAGIDALIRTRHDVYLAPGVGVQPPSARALVPGLVEPPPTVFVGPEPTGRTVCDGARSMTQLASCLQTSSAGTSSTNGIK